MDAGPTRRQHSTISAKGSSISTAVRQELRDVVLFASHSLLKDPPFSHIDLIACRNLLIYLDRELQELAPSMRNPLRLSA
jgi:chemotaxis methyl-accepting protein methylase